MNRITHNGVHVDTWAQTQTLNPHYYTWPKYSGYDVLWCGWRDLGIPELPLEVRYDSFKRRLGIAQARVK